MISKEEVYERLKTDKSTASKGYDYKEYTEILLELQAEGKIKLSQGRRTLNLLFLKNFKVKVNNVDIELNAAFKEL